jgi:hypothetical protein
MKEEELAGLPGENFFSLFDAIFILHLFLKAPILVPTEQERNVYNREMYHLYTGNLWNWIKISN